MSGWRIRLARPEDAAAMARIERDAASLFAGDTSVVDIALPSARSIEDYCALIANGHCLVAYEEQTGETIGHATCRAQGRELHLHDLGVATAHQGKGIGRRLLYAVIADARVSSFAAITLVARRDVAWSAPFFARHGFAEVTDMSGHKRLSHELAARVAAGNARESLCAMIRFLA